MPFRNCPSNFAQELKQIRLFPRGRRIGPSQHGYANKLQGLLALKIGREADAIVAVSNRDGKRNADRIVELNKARDDLRQQGKPCAAGVAVEMIEAWLLADERALRIGLENDEIRRQPDPEGLASRDEQSDQNPKRKLWQLITQSVGEIPSGDFPNYYAAVAKAADLQTVEQRCPIGFQLFAVQVRELVAGSEGEVAV